MIVDKLPVPDRRTELKARREIARDELRLGSQTVAYAIVRSDRARSIRLRITPHGLVEIVVPRQSRLPAARTVLEQHQAWILRHLESLRREQAAETGRLPYLGAEYPLAVERVDGDRAMVALDPDVLRVCLPAGTDLRDVLESWYRMRARSVLGERVERWSASMAIPYRRLTVRDQRTRWGSCSHQGNLNFSWRLVAAPLAVLDYVVVHELMHVREMHHGPRFWEGVARYCPDYERHRAWLRENGRRLSRVLEGEQGAMLEEQVARTTQRSER